VLRLIIPASVSLSVSNVGMMCKNAIMTFFSYIIVLNTILFGVGMPGDPRNILGRGGVEVIV